MKYKKSSLLNFKPVLKAEKEELIQWLSRYCDLFKFFYIPSKIRKLNIEISREIERGKLILGEVDNDIINTDGYTGASIFNRRATNMYFYIIKSGNAFSWFGLNDLGDRQKNGFTKIGVGEVKGKGIINEIFCESDVLLPAVDFFENPLAALTKKVHYLKLFSPIMGNIVSGIPFGKYIVPLVIIRISREELDEVLLPIELEEMYLNYLYCKLITNRWKLWGQWTNDRELKLLSILYLYFIGELPLQCWITADGEEVDNKGVSFKKPRCLIKEFEVGPVNLAFFVGLSRQAIFNYFSDKKGTVAKSDFSKLGVDIDALFEDLIKNRYINTDGVIQDKFYKIAKKLKGKPKGYSSMSLNLAYEGPKEQIYNILRLSPKKNIFILDKELANLLKCRVVPNEEFKFSSPEPLKLLPYIESKVLSPIIKKHRLSPTRFSK